MIIDETSVGFDDDRGYYVDRVVWLMLKRCGIANVCRKKGLRFVVHDEERESCSREELKNSVCNGCRQIRLVRITFVKSGASFEGGIGQHSFEIAKKK